ncbi:hypothetical protein AVEN_88537-1, partial [Araneus ventricosus]
PTSPAAYSSPTSPVPQVGRPSVDGNSFLFKPLPTTNFGNQQRQRRCSTESYTSTTSSDTEKDNITNQVGRTAALMDEPPLIITSSFWKQHEGYFGMDIIILNLGQMTRTAPELAMPSPNFRTPPAGKGLTSYVGFSMQQVQYTVDLHCNRVSNPEPSDPEADNLPIGQRGIYVFINSYGYCYKAIKSFP